MQRTAESWLVYRLTHSEFLLGVAWFCTQIAVFVLGPLGGMAADRFSRHKLVIVTQSLSMIPAFALAALTLTGHVHVWHVLALAVMLGAINAFDVPGRQSLIVQMTDQDDLLNAISLNSAMFNGARVVGPSIAGLVVAAFGEGVCFLINGLSFLAVLGSLLAMRLPAFERPAPESPWRHMAEGFHYAWHNSAVRRLLAVMAAAALTNVPVIVLMPVFADALFRRGARGLGILMGAMGVGAVIGTLGLARRTNVKGLAHVIVYSGMLLGVASLVFAYSTWFYFSLAVMVLIGYSMMRQMAAANTTIQTVVPDDLRGRTMALYAMAVVGLAPFGSLAAGALAGHFGAPATVAMGGILAIGAAALFGWSAGRNPIV